MTKLGIFLIAALAAGCTDDVIDDDVDGLPGDSDDTTPPDTAVELHANLLPDNPNSRLGGAALVTLLDEGRAFSATIQLRGDEPGSVRPWHVHVGECASGGPIVGPADAYPPLMIDEDGDTASETLISIPLDTGAYHVNVHLSVDEIATIIACGDLVRR